MTTEPSRITPASDPASSKEPASSSDPTSTSDSTSTSDPAATAGPILRAVRATRPLTAAEAVAWFAETTPPGGQIIGYALSPRAALWALVRPDGTVEWGDPGGEPLAEAYELVFFDGDRELRWLREPAGRGTAVALGEDPAALPPGEDVTADPPHRRGREQDRLLAGTASPHSRPEWTTLRGGRYAPAHLPCRLAGGDTLLVKSVEYLVADEHGNLDVADTRMVALRPTTLATQRAPGERTNR